MRTLGFNSGIDYSFLFNRNNSNSLFTGISLNKLSLIRSGTYKKMITSYMDAKKVISGKSKDIKRPKDTTEIKTLSNIKGISSKLVDVAERLSMADFSDKASLLDKTNNFINSYNSVIKSVDKLDNVPILRRIANMTGNMTASSKLLKRIGITIKSDNTLSVDEEVFKKANESDLELAFKGRLSLSGKIVSNSQIVNEVASNKISSATGTYNHTGSYYKSSLTTSVDVAV